MFQESMAGSFGKFWEFSISTLMRIFMASTRLKKKERKRKKNCSYQQKKTIRVTEDDVKEH